MLTQLHKPVIGYRIGKVMSQIPTDATEVTTLEFAVSPEMEEHENGHDLTGREGGFTVAVFFHGNGGKEVFLHCLLKFLIKFIYNEKNILSLVIIGVCFVTCCFIILKETK